MSPREAGVIADAITRGLLTRRGKPGNRAARLVAQHLERLSRRSDPEEQIICLDLPDP